MCHEGSFPTTTTGTLLFACFPRAEEEGFYLLSFKLEKEASCATETV